MYPDNNFIAAAAPLWSVAKIKFWGMENCCRAWREEWKTFLWSEYIL